MRSPIVVIVNPGGDFFAGVLESEKQCLVQQLVTHAAVETLAKAVLHRFAGRDEKRWPRKFGQ